MLLVGGQYFERDFGGLGGDNRAKGKIGLVVTRRPRCVFLCSVVRGEGPRVVSCFVFWNEQGDAG